jgi:dephospho-CoA kinase
MAAADADGAPAVVIEAIKLVDGGLAALCDEVWLVTCDAAAQRERLVERGMSRADADRRIAAQAGLVESVAPVATRVIDTSGTVPETRDLVAAAWAAAVGQGTGSSAGVGVGLAPGVSDAEGEGEGDGAGVGVIGPDPG